MFAGANMKKIFLTGASSGIGLATARALVGRGHEVWGTSRDARRVLALPGLHAVRMNLCDRASLETAFSKALSDAGLFDVLVNNAGSGHFGPAETLSESALRNQFELLFFGQVALCQLAFRAMQTRHAGLIINITSLAARLPLPFMAGYNAAKAAMASWTLTMQLELGDSPIRIVDLQPGDIRTHFNDAMRRDESDEKRYEARMDQAWRVIDRNMRNAPDPDVVAQRIVQLVEEGTQAPRVTVGDAFQAVVAPNLFSLLPPRLRVWGLRKYYRI